MNKFSKIFKKPTPQIEEKTPETQAEPAKQELCAKLLKGVDQPTQQKMYTWCNQHLGTYRDQWYGYALQTEVWMLFTAKQDLERFCKQFGVQSNEQAVDRPT
jgi:hypothetical protein